MVDDDDDDASPRKVKQRSKSKSPSRSRSKSKSPSKSRSRSRPGSPSRSPSPSRSHSRSLRRSMSKSHSRSRSRSKDVKSNGNVERRYVCDRSCSMFQTQCASDPFFICSLIFMRLFLPQSILLFVFFHGHVEYLFQSTSSSMFLHKFFTSMRHSKRGLTLLFTTRTVMLVSCLISLFVYVCSFSDVFVIFV